jgi:PAS domain-containing protein
MLSKARSSSDSQGLSAENSDDSEDAGIYLWDILRDKVFVDAAAAGVLGFSASEAKSGLPLSRWLERIHSEDLARVALAIRDAMLKGSTFHEDYRLKRADGGTVEVVVLGNCFCDEEGAPSKFTGILFPKEAAPDGRTTIRQLCMAAYDMARDEGRSDVATRLVDVLVMLRADKLDDNPPLGTDSSH